MVLEGSRPKPVAAFGGGENIFTIGSLSKMFCAGLRVGWVRSSKAQIGRLARTKNTMDLGSALLPQAIGAQLLTYLDEAVKLRREELLPKRDLVEKHLTNQLPDWSFARPCGGLCFWAKLPCRDTAAFAQVALRRRLAIAHGNLFSVSDGCSEYVRIPFLLDPESLEAGMEQLSEAWREMSAANADLRDRSPVIV